MFSGLLPLCCLLLGKCPLSMVHIVECIILTYAISLCTMLSHPGRSAYLSDETIDSEIKFVIQTGATENGALTMARLKSTHPVKISYAFPFANLVLAKGFIVPYLSLACFINVKK